MSAGFQKLASKIDAANRDAAQRILDAVGDAVLVAAAREDVLHHLEGALLHVVVATRPHHRLSLIKLPALLQQLQRPRQACTRINPNAAATCALPYRRAMIIPACSCSSPEPSSGASSSWAATLPSVELVHLVKCVTVGLQVRTGWSALLPQI